MGMRSWGMWGIRLDMQKAKEVAGPEYETMQKLIEEEDLDAPDLNQGEGSIELEIAMSKFSNKILNTLGVDIYLEYVYSEADGTDYAGENIWMIEPVFSDEVNNAMKDVQTWSEYS